MARPRIIEGDETKDIHVMLSEYTYDAINKDAHDRRTSMSAIMRALAEERYGAKG